MDYWDPTVTDGLARDREVILFNNAGACRRCQRLRTSRSSLLAVATTARIEYQIRALA
jgi:hypothetical protein